MGNNPDFLWDAEKSAHQFARDQRVRPFVEYQFAFHEDMAKDFKDLAGDTPLAAELEKLYGGDIKRVEFLVGLFAQQHADNEVLPSLMRTMVRIRLGSTSLSACCWANRPTRNSTRLMSPP